MATAVASSYGLGVAEVTNSQQGGQRHVSTDDSWRVLDSGGHGCRGLGSGPGEREHRDQSPSSAAAGGCPRQPCHVRTGGGSQLLLLRGSVLRLYQWRVVCRPPAQRALGD